MLFGISVAAVVFVLVVIVAYLLAAFIRGFVVEFRRLQRSEDERLAGDHDRDDY